MKRLFIFLVLMLSAQTHRASADNSGSVPGSISILVVDANKNGVAGINVTLTINGTTQTTTSGASQPTDAEVAAAAKQDIDCKCHAVGQLMSRYNATARFDGVAYGTGTLKIDAKNAKPLSVSISEAQPTWSHRRRELKAPDQREAGVR